MRIIPAIDIIDGQCVRLTQGDYQAKTVYHTNPLEVARSFEEIGIKYLHLVDLDGAKKGSIVNHKVLESICKNTNLTIDFGGGLQSDEDVKIAFESGASQITGGSIAVKKPELFWKWIQTYGSDKIILGADAKNEKIAISGWQDITSLDLIEFLDLHQKAGIKHVICTDISKDGLLQGPSTELYKKIRKTYPSLELIASGGVSTITDVETLESLGLSGAIIGKAIYESKITLLDLQNYILVRDSLKK